MEHPDVELEDHFTQEILDWATEKGGSANWDDHMPAVVMKLFLPWLMTFRAIETDTELTQRALPDAILRLVFSERTSERSLHVTRCAVLTTSNMRM